MALRSAERARPSSGPLLEAWIARAKALSPRLLLLVALPLGALGCAEGVALDRAVVERDQARIALAQRDQGLYALQWQLGYQAQQERARQQRDEALVRELWARLQALAVENAALVERAKKDEAERVAAEDSAREGAGKGKGQAACGPLRAEDLRRIQAAIDARNAPLAELLAKIERLLRERGAIDPRPGTRTVSPSLGEIIDPWGTRH